MILTKSVKVSCQIIRSSYSRLYSLVKLSPQSHLLVPFECLDEEPRETEARQ